MATGIVVSFDLQRGFGFIRSSLYREDVFVHIKDVDGQVPLTTGQRVQFVAQTSDRGLRATKVVPGRVGLAPSMVAAVVLIAWLVAFTVILHQQSGLGWIGAYLGAIGVATWAAFVWDKRQAGLEGRRVPESVLLGLALVGGSPVALVAMFALHHKSSKRSFQAKFAAVVIVQGVALAGWYFFKKT